MRATGKTTAELFRWMFENANRQLDRDAPEAYELGARGWTFTDWLPIYRVRAFASAAPADLDRYVLRAYGRNRRAQEQVLFAAITADPALAPWSLTLGDAVKAYRSRLYQVVVPTLFPMLEGLLIIAAGTYIRNTAPPVHIASRRRATASDAGARLLWYSVEAFASEAFANRQPGTVRGPVPNRHLLLHGRDVAAWQRVDCLRLFQALHTVAYLLEDDRR
jgi:hypothetical protein